MSQGSIPNREPESYQDFAYRFQLAEGLPCDRKGIIFIGNTRAGKSTLALAMTGAAMKVVYGSGELTYLNPSDKAYKDIVKNTQQSVTEKPNFYPRKEGHNSCAVVDMPGHADSSRLRQLINFHYIRTMAANLEEVRFLIVVTLQYKNGRFEMPRKELEMLNSFRIMFPDCSDCLNIVINRIQKAAVNTPPACACFREAVTQAGSEISSFYSGISDKKIHVIQRPPYVVGRHGEKEYQAPYNAINRRMQEICNSEAEFMRLSEHSYYSPNIFREDNVKNTQFYLKLMQINHKIHQGVNAASALFKETLSIIIRSILREGKIAPCKDELINIFDIFLAKYSIDTPQKRTVKPIEYTGKALLESTKIMQIVSVLSHQRFIFVWESISKEDGRKILKYKQQFCKDIADTFSSKLLQIIQITFGKGQLYEKVMEFYIYLLRKIDESYFIAHILQERNQILPQQSQETGALYNIFNQFKIMNTDFLTIFESLVEESVHFCVPTLFRRFNPNQYEQLKNQLLDNFNIIETHGFNCYGNKENFKTSIIPSISIIKQEINLFVVVNSEPTTPQQTATHIQKLLKMYQSAEVNARVPMVQKMVKLLQRQKQYKNALVLCIHLSLNEDAVRLLDLLQPTLSRDTLGRFLGEVAASFEENGMFYYAIRTLQMAKRNSIGELDRFIQYQRKILNLNDPTYTSKIVQKRLQNKSKEGFWNWAKINDEVLFLKQKFRIKDQSPSKSIMLKSYR